MKKKKRILSLVLVLMLGLGLSAPAFAEGDMGKVGERNIISAANSCTAAVDENGVLWTWGLNMLDGRLGNGTKKNSNVPIKVLDGVASVSCQGASTAAIKTDGTLWMWGVGDLLGNGGQGNDLSPNGTGDPIQTIPVKVLDNVAAVSFGEGHTTAIKTDDSLWAWGSNYYGQLGNGTTENSLIPVKVLDDVAAVNCGSNHTAAIKTDGSLWMWGGNRYGQLGNGGQGNATVTEFNSQYLTQTIPVKVLDNVAAVTCGNTYTIAVKTDGTLWTWGSNTWGELGNGEGNMDSIRGSNDLIQTIPAQITLGGGASMPRGVRLNLNGGYGGGTLWISANGTITVPTNPTRPGYTFGGWYTDAALTIPWNFNDKVVKVLVLYAKWTPVSSTATTTTKSSQSVSINGSSASFDAYTLIADNGGEVTYVKLRDIAALMEDTDTKFNVDWRNGAIYVSTETPYTTKNGTELKPISGTDGSYKWNTAPVLFDGVTKSLEGIVLTDSEGGGHTFFKLRDLGEAIGFDVGWSAERGIYIETT